MGDRPAVAKGLIVFFAVLTAITIVGFLIPWRRPVASTEGAGIDTTITYLLVVSGILVICGHAILIRFIWHSSRREEAAAYGRPSKRAEWAWSIIPVLLMTVLSEAGVLVVSGPVWDSIYAEKPENPVTLEVAGKQFEWYVRYPGKDGKFGTFDLKRVNETDNLFGLDDDDEAAQDDIVKRGQICLPLGRPVVIRLHTYDVIHSFFVPQFRLKQDLIPGYMTQIKFTPSREGEFDLACAELCGLGHYTMKGKVRVVKPEEYETWLSQQMTFGG
jgi:cytochrome c oxidase subunit 2